MFILIFGVLTDDQRDLVEQLFKDNHIKFYHISLKILKSEDNANEAISAAFLKIIDNIEKISDLPCRHMLAFCVTIVKNTSIDIIRRSKKLTLIESFDNVQDEQSNNPEDEYIKSTEIQKMSALLLHLSEEERHLVYLRYVDDMGYEDIGKLLEIPGETAKKRGQRVLKKLRKLYGTEKNQ